MVISLKNTPFHSEITDVFSFRFAHALHPPRSSPVGQASYELVHKLSTRISGKLAYTCARFLVHRKYLRTTRTKPDWKPTDCNRVPCWNNRHALTFGLPTSPIASSCQRDTRHKCVCTFSTCIPAYLSHTCVPQVFLIIPTTYAQNRTGTRKEH